MTRIWSKSYSRRRFASLRWRTCLPNESNLASRTANLWRSLEIKTGWLGLKMTMTVSSFFFCLPLDVPLALWGGRRRRCKEDLMELVIDLRCELMLLGIRGLVERKNPNVDSSKSISAHGHWWARGRFVHSSDHIMRCSPCWPPRSFKRDTWDHMVVLCAKLIVIRHQSLPCLGDRCIPDTGCEAPSCQSNTSLATDWLQGDKQIAEVLRGDGPKSWQNAGISRLRSSF